MSDEERFEQGERQKQNKWTVNADPEIKEDIKKLASFFNVSEKQLLEMFVADKKADMLKGSPIETHEDFEHLNYHLTRIREAYQSMIQKTVDLRDQYRESIEKQKSEHQEALHAVIEQKNSAVADADIAKEDLREMKKHLEEVLGRNTELEQNYKSNQLTISLLENKKQELESKIAAVEALEAEVTQLRKDNDAAGRQIDSLTSELNQAQRDLAATKERLQQVEQDKKESLAKADQDKEKSLAQAKQASDREIEQLKHVHQLEMDKAAIEADRRVLEAGQKVRDEYAQKLESLTTRNQELLERIHTLELQNKL